MGLTIQSMPVYEGLTQINNVYVNIRDIITTKDAYNRYSVRFLTNYSKEDKAIKSEMVYKQLEIPHTNNIWQTCYDYLKEELRELGLIWSDNIN